MHGQSTGGGDIGRGDGGGGGAGGDDGSGGGAGGGAGGGGGGERRRRRRRHRRLRRRRGRRRPRLKDCVEFGEQVGLAARRVRVRDARRREVVRSRRLHVALVRVDVAPHLRAPARVGKRVDGRALRVCPRRVAKRWRCKVVFLAHREAVARRVQVVVPCEQERDLAFVGDLVPDARRVHVDARAVERWRRRRRQVRRRRRRRRRRRNPRRRRRRRRRRRWWRRRRRPDSAAAATAVVEALATAATAAAWKAEPAAAPAASATAAAAMAATAAEQRVAVGTASRRNRQRRRGTWRSRT